MRAPPNARAAADHVGEDVVRIVRVLDEVVELRVAGVGDAQALDDEVGVDPLAEIFLIGDACGVGVLLEAEGEVLGGGVGPREDRGVPVVDRAVARLLWDGVSPCYRIRPSHFKTYAERLRGLRSRGR